MHASMKEIVQSEEDKAELIKYARNPIGFLLLTGNNGSGKSYAAEAIYNANTPYRLPQHDHDVAYFVNAADLYQLYLNKMFESEGLRTDLKRTKLLVIDDLCPNENEITDAFSSFLYSIIDFRWQERDKLSTIITTNLNSEQMGKKLGPAFRSRVASGIRKRWDHPDRRLNIEFQRLNGDFKTQTNQ